MSLNSALKGWVVDSGSRGGPDVEGANGRTIPLRDWRDRLRTDEAQIDGSWRLDIVRLEVPNGELLTAVHNMRVIAPMDAVELRQPPVASV
ncbi:hypothetical protein ABIC52_001047 [Curtobacterium oceanosedimentum]